MTISGRWRLWLWLVLLVGLSACSSDDGGFIEIVRFGESDLMTYTPVGTDSATALLEGTLEERDGCVVVLADTDTVAVVIPADWVRDDPPRIAPPGHAGAQIGDHVRFGGGQTEVPASDDQGACHSFPVFAVGSVA